MQQELYELSETVGERLMRYGDSLVTAESCTGGLIAKLLTDVPGSSAWFDRAYVTYSNPSKVGMLGVEASILESDGAVSEAVVRQMAAGALGDSGASVVIATSGIAGPGGGSADKPVGTVWVAWGRVGQSHHATRLLFNGDRNHIRELTAQFALQAVLGELSG